MNTLHRVSRRQVVGCGLLLAAGGCSRGPRTVHVAGEVSYQGKPVPEGLIVFFPVDGTAGPSTGGAIANGHYDIPARSGPRAGGTYRVEITAYGPERQYSPNVSGEGPNISVRDQLIPPKFNQNSSLRATITDVNTRDTHDFDL